MSDCAEGLNVGLGSRDVRGPQFDNPGMSPRGEVYLNHGVALHPSSSTLLPHHPQQYFNSNFLLQKKTYFYSYGTYQTTSRSSHSTEQFNPSRILDSICCYNNILAILYSKRNLAVEKHPRALPCFYLQRMERCVSTDLTS
jgi:hypothetical protein